MAFSLISGMLDKPVPDSLIAFGEIGLSGEVRAVSQPSLRMKEARKLGFASAITPPRHSKDNGKSYDLNVFEIGNVQRLINMFN